MKKSKKLRVSWPSDSLLCQVKMFPKDDCPANISSHQSIIKPKAMNLLPPGYERTQYASSRMRNKISHIPRIKWKKPPKFIVNGALLVVNGEESRETRDENLRIDKVLEALYPHRSAISHSPSVSLAVEVERYDDSKTPNIRLTPIEDEPQAASFELPSPTKQVLPPATTVSGLGPEFSLALTALMKQNKEQGSNIDADLLVKLLSDPNMVKNLLMHGTKGTNTKIVTKPSLVPQHVTSSSSSAMDIASFPRNGFSVQSSVSVAATDQPLLKPIQPVSSIKPCSVFHTYQLSTGMKKPLQSPQDSYQTAISRSSPVDAVLVSVSEQKSVPIPQSQSFKVVEPMRNGTDSQTGNGLARNVPVSVQSSVSVATTEPPQPKSSQAMCSVLSMKPSSVVHTYPLSVGLKKPQGLSQTIQFEQNPVDAVSVSVSEQKTVRNGTDPQTRTVAYSNDQVSAGPVKNLDYFKNLIREHGGVVIPPAVATRTTKVTNNYKGRVVQNVKKVNNKKVQKQCMYFGKGKGCKLGDSCLFLHDQPKRVWPTNVAADFPREAKRFKFGT